MTTFDPVGAGPSADSLVASLLDLPEARGFALDALVRLSSIEFDEHVATACVECAASPRLLFNQHFVAKHCTTTRRLAFLVLHELAHVSLGHTGLHARTTVEQNIAFDAVINASLLHGLVQDGSANGWDGLVVDFYAADDTPSFLLRPPPGWPERSDWRASRAAPDALRSIHRRLYEVRRNVQGYTYSPLHTVTYGEIIAALDEIGALGDPAKENGAAILARLLGSHGTTDRERAAESGGRDGQLAVLLSAVLDELPRNSSRAPGSGADPFKLRIPRARPDARMIAALRRLLVGCLTDRGERSRPREESVTVWGADPSRDRRAAVRRLVASAVGAPETLLHRAESHRKRPTPDGRTAIYLDVSGSMAGVLEPLHAALVTLRRRLAPKVFVFSDVVEEMRREAFVGGNVTTTGGTSIDPVLGHLASEARAGRTKRAVLLTDGYFAAPSAKVLKAYLGSGAELHVGTVAASPPARARWVRSVTRLPDIHTPGGTP